MVRLKDRYLLVQILYPSNLPSTSTSASASRSTPAKTLLSPSPPTANLLSLYAPTSDSITSHSLLLTLRTSIQTLFGEHGAAVASAGLLVKYWSNATSSFVIRCRRDVLRMVWAAVSFVCSMSEEGVERSETADRGERGKGGRSRPGDRGRTEARRTVECVWRVVHVSGTVRKCEEEAVRRARGLLGRARGLNEAEGAGVDVEAVAGLGKAESGASGGNGNIDGGIDEMELGSINGGLPWAYVVDYRGAIAFEVVSNSSYDITPILSPATQTDNDLEQTHQLDALNHENDRNTPTELVAVDSSKPSTRAILKQVGLATV